MGRRGPEPLHDKRDEFARLIAEGVPSVRACRIVGINPGTGSAGATAGGSPPAVACWTCRP